MVRKQQPAAMSTRSVRAQRNTSEATQTTLDGDKKKNMKHDTWLWLAGYLLLLTGALMKEGLEITADGLRLHSSAFTSPSAMISCSKYSSIEDDLGFHPSVLRVTLESYTLAAPVTANSGGVSSPLNLGIFLRL